MNTANFWQAISDAVWDYINKNSPPSNVLKRFNILGGNDMKEEVLAQYKQGQETLLSDLYEAAKADGAAGAQASGITPDQLEAAKNEGFEAGKAEGFTAGVASVHIPETPVGEGQPGYSQEQYDAVKAEADAAKAQVESVKAELAASKESEAVALSDDASDKEKIDALTAEVEAKKAMVDKIDALIHGL